MKFVVLLALALIRLDTAGGFVTPTKTGPSLLTSTSLQVAGGFRNDDTSNKKAGAPAAAQDRQGYWGEMPLHQQRDRRYRESPSVPANKAVTPADVRRMDDVMINEDYWLTWAMAMLGPLIIWYHPSYAADGSPSLIGVAGGLFHILFASLLWVQTRRVRMVFEKTGFEFYNIKGPGLDLEKGAWLERKPDNYVAGTQNRWSYESVINYGFFPSLDFPVICYFKETETPEWKWNRWFAAFDSYQGGQPHFFPGICSAREVKAEFEKRGVKRKPVKTVLQKGADAAKAAGNNKKD